MKSVFFCYPNVHQLATSYNGTIRVRQGEREREKKAEKPHERRRRLHLSFWHCNSQSSKLSSLESSICFCGLLSLIVCPTFFFFFLIESSLFLNTVLQKRLSVRYFARTSVESISSEKLLSASFHMLMHEYRNPDTAVSAQYVYSTATPLRVQAI